MQLGLSTYSYPWAVAQPSLRPTDLLALTLAHNIRRLQIGDNLPLHALPDAEREAFFGEARAGGVQLEIGTRRLEAEHVVRYLDYCPRVGSPFLRLVIDDDDYHPPLPEIRTIICDLLPELRRRRVVLALENHDRFRAHELADIIEATDPEWVGICLDTANSLGAGEGLYEVARTLVPYTLNLHIKDIRIQRLPHKMGFTVTGCPAGQGQLPIADLLSELRATGRCISATLEVWSTPLDTPEATREREARWVAASLDYLGDLIGTGPPP